MKKKIIFSLILVVAFLLSINIGSLYAEVRATKTTAGFYRSDIDNNGGIATNGTGQLTTKGYSRTLYVDSNIPTFLASLTNDDVIFVNSHGNTGFFTLAPGVRVEGSVISSTNVTANTRLVYISACRTGENYTSSTNVCNVMRNKGVDTVVAFKENVTMDSVTGGCDRFDSIFVYKWGVGYSVAQSISLAKSQIYSETGQYWGTDSYVIFGNGLLTLY